MAVGDRIQVALKSDIPTLSTLGITASATELNYVKGVTSAVQTQINGKAPTSHTHTKSQITDFPTTLPANGGNSDTVDNLHFSVATVIPTSLADNIVCLVREE